MKLSNFTKFKQSTVFSLSILVILGFSLFTMFTPISAQSHEINSSVEPQQVSEPDAKVINVNPAYPDINQNIGITADVISPAGVDTSQVDLIYEYRSVPGEGTISMVGSTTSLAPNQFNSIKTLEPNQKGVNFTYLSDYIDNVDITINAGGPGNPNFIYFEYSYYDLETSNWILIDQQSGISLDPVNFAYSGIMGGFSFYAIVQRGNDGGNNVPDDPTFDVSSVIESTRQFTATITAPGATTAIDYYIKAVDLDGTTFYSNNYTVYSNSRPSIEFNNLTSEIAGQDNYLLNTTIADPDGVEFINSATAYYKLSSDTIWYSQSLSEDSVINSTAVIYTGSLNLTMFRGYEENINIFVNASDIVDSAIQPAVESSTESVFFDRRGPVLLNSISITADPLINNSTKINETISLEATFTDPNGVSDANVVFQLNNGTVMQQNMVNTTELLDTETIEDFTFEFPGYMNSTEIQYFFQTTDFTGNTYNSKLYLLYVDADGPTIIEQAFAPKYPSNSTGVSIVYNIWDASGLASQEFSYQEEGDTAWDTVTIDTINYDQEISQEELFELVPGQGETNIGNIRDDNITSFSLEIQPSITADEAFVDIEFTHQRSSDLRIYLVYLDQSYLVFDREDTSTVSFSLRDYILLSSLGLENVTIEVHDIVEDFVGVMNSISVNLIDYFVPADFTYKVTIPPYNNDTTINYYFTFEDNLGNIGNSSVFSVYLDGLPPVIIDYTQYNNTVDAEGSTSLPMQVIVEEQGTIDTVELYYRYSTDGTWLIEPLTLVNGSEGTFEGGIPLQNNEGMLFYQVRVFDKVGYSDNSTIHNFSYINANAPIIELITDTSQVMDLSGSETATIVASVTDDTEVTSVIIFFTVNDGDEQSANMEMTANGQYFYEIEVDQSDGSIDFYIQATDNDGQTSTSQAFTLEYINADVSFFDEYLPFVIAGAAIIALGGIGYAIYRRRVDNPTNLFTKIPANNQTSDDYDWDDDDF